MSIIGITIRKTIYFLLSGLLLTYPAFAETPSVSERYESWELICSEGLENNSVKTCRISQKLAVEESKQVVFALTIVPGDKKGQMVGIVSFPLGGYIAPGIELRVDNKKAYKILVETCNSSGCHAGFPLTANLLKEFERGKTASFRLWTEKAKSADIAVHLSGFSSALKALKDRMN